MRRAVSASPRGTVLSRSSTIASAPEASALCMRSSRFAGTNMRLRTGSGSIVMHPPQEEARIVYMTTALDGLRILEIELALADLETVESRIEKRRKAAKQDKSLTELVEALDAAHAVLAEGTPIYRGDLTADQRAVLKEEFLLTNKPVLALVNVGEGDLDRIPEIIAPVEAELGNRAEVIGMCVQLEAEAAQFSGPERLEMLEALGLGEGGLERFIHAAYHLMGLRTYLTTGEKESRAWTFRAGYKAPQCAGVIHSDFERGFIRAEVIRWDELLEIGSWAKAKDVGKIRVEGKDYEVADGDVLEFRFNV